MKRVARESMLCPACSRFVGPSGSCPYCEVDLSAFRPGLRRLRGLALWVTCVGLVLLYVVAMPVVPEAVAIGEIRPAMNFALVSVRGSVERDAYVSRDGNYLSFRISDGSGTMLVAAYGRVARDLLASETVPRKGMDVVVMGNVNVSDSDRTRIILADHSRLVMGTETP